MPEAEDGGIVDKRDIGAFPWSDDVVAVSCLY